MTSVLDWVVVRDPKGVPGGSKGSTKPWKMSGVREAGAMGAGLRPRCESDTLPRRDYRARCAQPLGRCLEMEQGLPTPFPRANGADPLRESSAAVIEDRLPKQEDREGLENHRSSFLSVLLKLAVHTFP